MDSGYSLNAPFLRRRTWRMSPCAGHFAIFCGTKSGTRVRGGPGGTQGGEGAWTWKPQPGKPLSSTPEPIGAGDLTKAEVFMGPRGALLRGSHWELCFLDWEKKVWVKLQRSGCKLECIPQWTFIFAGMCDAGEEALYEGSVKGLTITGPIKPLGRAAPATGGTTAPTGAPHSTPPSATAHFWTALGAMGTVGPKPDFKLRS